MRPMVPPASRRGSQVTLVSFPKKLQSGSPTHLHLDIEIHVSWGTWLGDPSTLLLCNISLTNLVGQLTKVTLIFSLAL